MQAVAASTAAQRPFTVSDAIELATIDGYQENRLQRSPDGRRLVFATTKGDLHSGDRITTLRVIERDGRGAFVSRPLLERRSRLNADPVSAIRWVNGGAAIAFLSPDNQGRLQIFRHDLSTGKTEQVTWVEASVISFDIKQDVAIFYASVTHGSPPYPAPGGYLGPESLSRLLFPDEDSLGELSTAFLQRGSEKAIRLTEPVGSLARELTRFAIAPSGKMAIAILPAAKPNQAFLDAWASLPGQPKLTDVLPQMALQVKLVDLTTGKTSELISAPTGIAIDDYSSNLILWSTDSKRVIVTNTLLGPRDLKSGAAIPSTPQTVEVAFEGQLSVRKIASDDLQPGERVAGLHWQGARQLVVESAAGAGGGVGLASVMSEGRRWRSRFELGQAGWSRISRDVIPLSSAVALNDTEFSIVENANTPPRIIATRNKTRGGTVVFDPNPQLRAIKLLPIRPVQWVDQQGHVWSGGLVLPSKQDQSIPVVIALKSHDPTRFAPDGPYTTAFATQALAAQGIAVLEVNAFDAATMGTALEGPLQMRGIESAVDFLGAQYNVDRGRVGLIGFSRTCYHVAYTLTHSSYRFAAATMADGLSGGYIQYHAFSLNHSPGNGVKPLYDALNEGPPTGATLSNWLKRSPAFNADKIATPLRIEMLGRSSALQEWELYSALKLSNRPVEALYLPDAAHVLLKPKERYLSQQGNVNWFNFWLQPELGPSRDARFDYNRWHSFK